MIKAEALTKIYETNHLALDALHLEVKKGQIYTLLGANGAGKTTTQNLFLGFIQPTSGQAYIDAIDVSSSPLEAKRKVAFLDENVMLYENMTAIQNARFFVNLGKKVPIKTSTIEACLAQAGLQADAWRKKCGGFSKGMRQKVGLAIVMAKDAPAIFLDEPTSGLDPRAATELMNSLRMLRDEGKAILMNTHDIFRARQISDCIGIMKDGSLLRELTHKEAEKIDVESLYLEYVA